MPRSFTNDDYQVSQFLNTVLLREATKNLTRDNLFSINVFTLATAQNIVVPPMTALAETQFQPGGSALFIASGAAAHTITPGVGVTINGSGSAITFSATPYETAVNLVRIDNNEWAAIRSIAVSSGSPAFDDVTISGDLLFDSTAQRILGDFHNPTFANRLAFKDSEPGNETKVVAIPSGENLGASWQSWTAESMNNCYRSYMQIYNEGVGTNFVQFGMESVGLPVTPQTDMKFELTMYGNTFFRVSYDGTPSGFTAELVFGQLKFPSVENPSADANTLDDYQENNAWLPNISFVNPGDLSVAYAVQVSRITKIGRLVVLEFSLTFTPTFTTASGSLVINNVPDAAAAISHIGTLQFTGITLLGYTSFASRLGAVNNTSIDFVGSGSGLGAIAISTAHIASGVQMILRGSISYCT